MSETNEQGRSWQNLYKRTFEEADALRNEKISEGFDAKVKRVINGPSNFVVKYRTKED